MKKLLLEDYILKNIIIDSFMTPKEYDIYCLNCAKKGLVIK